MNAPQKTIEERIARFKQLEEQYYHRYLNARGEARDRKWCLYVQRRKMRCELESHAANLVKLDDYDYPFEPGERDEAQHWDPKTVADMVAGFEQIILDDYWLESKLARETC